MWLKASGFVAVTIRPADVGSPQCKPLRVVSRAPSSERSTDRAKRWGTAAAIGAASIGLFWLAVWLSGTPEAIALASARCKANTALALVTMGLGYVGLLRRARGTSARLARLAIVLAGGLGVLTIIQYAGGVSFGIDELIARDTASESLQFPNRMSPSAAVCFTLLALAGLLLPRRDPLSTALGQASAVLALTISSVALIGYLYSASILYRPLPFVRLSPYTATAIALLVAAALSLRPDAGLVRALSSPSIGGYLARRLLPVTLLLPMSVGYLLLDARGRSLLSPAESHALLTIAVSVVMAPTVLFLALSLDRIERGRLEAEAFLRSTSELTAALSRARTVDEVVNVTLDLGLPALGARAGTFLRVSESGQELETVGARGFAPGSIDASSRFSIDDPYPVAVAVKRREAVFIGSPAERSKLFPSLPAVTTHASWAALPLEGSGGALGAIALSFSGDRSFDSATRERARQLAWQCAQALDRALLFDSEQHARERAEAASRAKDEFLAMLGHELRNPLSPIITSLHLMDLKDSRESAREREVIRRQVSHMVRLVDDLLDVSRIASGRVELRRRSIEMASVVRAALELVTPLIQQRQHRVTVEVPSEGLLVEADHERLVQVLSNLLTNSAKYSNVRGHIVVSCQKRGDNVVTRIADDGVGIAPELLPSVFDLFVQGKRTLERSEGGLGLGLALVRSLVELHGGTVSAHSEGLGKGSVFTVQLPASTAPSLELGPDSVRPPARKGAARRLLLVDDNRDAADSMAQALRQEGHDVRVAYDGPSALALAAAFDPHVGFFDIGLPVMDGYELARRLRSTNPESLIALVAVTGYGQSADRERSRRAGFDRHLVKPVAVSDLTTLLAELAPGPPDSQQPQRKTEELDEQAPDA